MVEIESSISVEELNKYKERALKKLGAEIAIDGFRKGHIPENILLAKIGEMPFLNETAEMALSDIYPVLILKNKIDAIGRPQITITKMAPGNPVEFKIKTAVLPECLLPDYKKIAQKINGEKQEKIEVLDKEVADAIAQIQRTKSGKVEAPQIKKGGEKTDTPKLPELTDEFVKKMGAFKNVADFKNKIRENIKQKKEQRARENKRARIIDGLLAETKIVLPEIIIATETERMFAQVKNDISRMGLKFDKYLEHLKKTEEDLRKELAPEAEKRAKIQMILDKIIKEEKIKPTEEEIKKNVAAILEQHRKVPNQNEQIKEENIRPYVEMVLSNQEVFKLLEKA